VTLLRLSRSFPKIENYEVLKELYDKKQPAMFVANHCSWMDIPFLGATVGWRNYKLVSKKELGVIPILGTAIRVGGNLLLDRTDRRSQFRTLKQGINLLEKVGSCHSVFDIMYVRYARINNSLTCNAMRCDL
jgi:1-acyl-sn-glycerol-3-phosphate acyltransferase